MDNVIEKEVKKIESKISDLFKNVAGQFAIDEVLKFAAGAAGVLLAGIYLFTGLIPVEREGFVKTVEVVLWAYTFGQGAVGNITKQ